MTAYALNELQGDEREKFESDLASDQDLQRELESASRVADGLALSTTAICVQNNAHTHFCCSTQRARAHSLRTPNGTRATIATWTEVWPFLLIYVQRNACTNPVHGGRLRGR